MVRPTFVQENCRHKKLWNFLEKLLECDNVMSFNQFSFVKAKNNFQLMYTDLLESQILRLEHDLL